MEAYDPKTGKKHETLKFEKPRKKDIVFLKKCKNILIVDDIFDTGASLEKVTDFIDTIKRNQINNDYKIFTLIEKIRSENESVIIKSLRQITYSGIKDDTEDWIVFPWDDDYDYLMRKWDLFNPAINSKMALSGPHIKDLNG